MTAQEELKGRLIVADSVHCADMRYQVGVAVPDPFLWYDVDGHVGIVVSALEESRLSGVLDGDVAVHAEASVKREWGLKGRRSRFADLITGLARATGCRRWDVPGSFPFGIYYELRRSGLVLRPVAPFCERRECKRAAEITFIREGVETAEAGLARAVEILAASRIGPDAALRWGGAVLTSERLRGEVDAAVARVGGTASDTIAAAGVQGADPHQAGYGPIHACQPIVLDIFPRVDATGYFGDLTRTVVKGTASETVRRAYTAVREAQQAAVRRIRAGRRGPEVHQAAVDAVTRHGFKTDAGAHPPYGFFHGTGHGLGLEIHEAPRLNATADIRLRAGHVVTVEPGLYYTAWGGVRLENVVAVTADGVNDMTTAPYQLEIA